MAAGIALARKGLQVTIFEAGDNLGGCCATTSLGGYTFNDGALYLALPEILDHGFERLGLDRAELLPLRQITAKQTTHLDNGASLSFETGTGVRRSGTDSASDLDRQLASLKERWEPVLKILGEEIIPYPASAPRMAWKLWRHLPRLAGTVASELGRQIDDPQLRAALASMALYTGVPAERTPAAQMVGIAAVLCDRIHLPKGGMGRIPQVLTETFQALGGEVRLNTRVERIAVRGGRVAALETDTFGSVPVGAAVSTANGISTTLDLLGPEDRPRAATHRARRAPLSHRALSVQLGLANRIDAPSHFMNHVPCMEAQHHLLQETAGVPRWIAYTVPTVTMPELSPAGGSIVEMYPPVDANSWPEDWDAARAESVADKAIEALSRHHRLDIAVRRVRSPRDFRDDMHLYKGAIYGLSPTADLRSQFPLRSGVGRLYQAGQTVFPGYGVGPALMSGIHASDALIHDIARG